jgi:hypothetical protein
MRFVCLVHFGGIEEPAKAMEFLNKWETFSLSQCTWLFACDAGPPRIGEFYEKLIEHAEEIPGGVFVTALPLNPGTWHTLNHHNLAAWLRQRQGPGQ